MVTLEKLGANTHALVHMPVRGPREPIPADAPFTWSENPGCRSMSKVQQCAWGVGDGRVYVGRGRMWVGTSWPKPTGQKNSEKLAQPNYLLSVPSAYQRRSRVRGGPWPWFLDPAPGFEQWK